MLTSRYLNAGWLCHLPHTPAPLPLQPAPSPISHHPLHLFQATSRPSCSSYLSFHHSVACLLHIPLVPPNQCPLSTPLPASHLNRSLLRSSLLMQLLPSCRSPHVSSSSTLRTSSILPKDQSTTNQRSKNQARLENYGRGLQITLLSTYPPLPCLSLHLHHWTTLPFIRRQPLGKTLRFEKGSGRTCGLLAG